MNQIELNRQKTLENLLGLEKTFIERLEQYPESSSKNLIKSWLKQIRYLIRDIKTR